jgi:hypothetical protein
MTTSSRACSCETLRGTGEFSVRRLPEPSVSFEAVCDACGTTYWLSAEEAAKALPAESLAAGRRELESLRERVTSPSAEKAREARRKFSALRPVRDALILLARKLMRPFSRR